MARQDIYGLPVKPGRPRKPYKITKLRSVETLNFTGKAGKLSWPDAFKGMKEGDVHSVSKIFSHDEYSEEAEWAFYRQQSEAIRKAKQRTVAQDPTIKLRKFQTYRNRSRNPDLTVTVSVTLRRMA